MHLTLSLGAWSVRPTAAGKLLARSGISPKVRQKGR